MPFIAIAIRQPWRGQKESRTPSRQIAPYARIFDAYERDRQRRTEATMYRLSTSAETAIPTAISQENSSEPSPPSGDIPKILSMKSISISPSVGTWIR
jgi:hypothetical protein